jgi:tRNA-splicing ligase RtcB
MSDLSHYVQKETHFGEEVYLIRKGAVSAQRCAGDFR